MKLYNTLHHEVEEFIPNSEEVKLYTCGPTVYHFSHIGNLRSYVAEDILEKTLNYVGYKVKRAMNITDVGHLTSDSDSGDDKMLKGAKRENKTVMEIAKFYTDAFFADCKDLNIKKPEIVVPATSQIDKYIEIIKNLLDKGYAYISGNNVYFDTSKLDDYYVLTNHKEDEMVVGVREGVEEDSNKKNQADFVLWFTKSKFENQELKWNSPWGFGYPGWHIECTGISINFLGEYLDIHCGGVDNIFPHHTNEIAQSESYLGHKWCNYWFHVEHLNDQNGKMSKSNGEFLTISLLKEKGYNPLSYRFMLLQSHYRKQIVFSYDNLANAENSYLKLLSKIKQIPKDGDIDEEKFGNYDAKFIEAIENDLGTPNALTILYDLLKDDSVNGNTKRKLIESWDKVFSLDLLKEEKLNIDEEYIKEMINKRNDAKANKDYALADKIREELLSQNIVLKDTREGTIYEVR